MNKISIPLNLVALFSADRQVYRSFGYLIAAHMGTLLLVPPHLVLGDLAKVIYGSPVPDEEIYAVLEYPPVHPLTNPAAWPASSDHVQQLEYLGLDPDECVMDTIAPMVRGEERVLRLVHPCGVRYAVVMA